MAQAPSRNIDDTLASFALEDFLPYRLSVLANTVSQALAQTYQGNYGLSVPEWRVLAVLGRFPGLTATELCERIVMDKVTVSRAVRSLLARKYLRRGSDPSDRRRRPLMVTAGHGRSVLARIIPLALAFERRLRACLDQEQARTLEELLAVLSQHARSLDGQASQPPAA